jgi:hypothetical protein
MQTIKNAKTFHVHVQKKKNDPHHGHHMVDVDLVIPKPLHTYYNNNFYTTNLQSFITLP